MIWVVIAVGGGLGALARHGLNVFLSGRYGSSFPFGIVAVNASGCFLIGLLAGLLAATRLHLGEHTRTFLVVGVLGGFTTFSAYGLDTFTLLRGGHTTAGLLNGVGQMLLGIAAVWAGFSLGSWRP